MAGREGWKTATAGRAEKPEQKRERERGRQTQTNTFTQEAETTTPRIEAAITAGKHAGSSDGSPRILRTPTQPGIGSPSPDTVSPGSSSDLGTETVTQPPLCLHSSGVCRIPLTHTHTHSHRRHKKHQSPGGSRYSRRDWTEIKHRAMRLCAPTHTHTHTGGDNG